MNKFIVSLSLVLFCVHNSFAQSARVQPPSISAPDLLTEEPSVSVDDSVETPPSRQDSPQEPNAAAQTPRPSTQPAELEDIVETDSEPVPIIKRNRTRIDTTSPYNSRFIEHPNAEKGLIKIDKDKRYIYKVEQSPQKNAGSFKIAFYEPINLENPADPDRVTFESVYDENQAPLFIYEHEWQRHLGFGKWGWTVGGGLFFAQGQGQFKDPNINERALEEFILLVFPVHAGGIYRAKFWDYQWVVPYAGGGIGGMAFAERRDDDKNPAWGARLGFSPNAVAYGGLAIQMGSGPRSFLDLDREYGINRVYLTAEFRTYLHFGGNYDFSGDAINGGITAEF